VLEWLYPKDEVDTYDWNQTVLMDKVSGIRRDIKQFYKDYPRHAPQNIGKSKKELKLIESMQSAKSKLSDTDKLRMAIGKVNDF
jgi:hypothetical protein